ncbi:F0F1 ATP synthase subunit B [Clostridium tarantellae]|uniref:ATP synthase subunit b n=1 Tax=Clostridium tarantellae TaxID=39493 RepID=A0A6I1MK64_9CLOT|nr:F0F1 ATP synthase subunit B [Clostridium tarantellae]MPQ42537.1 F0F1 ATP synthase subunit B [Clostridium tarantellae]
MGINIAKIIITIINFIALTFILKHFFWEKIKAAIENRESEIEEKILQADDDAEKARRLRIENERILKSAKEEGKKITAEQKRKADKFYQEIVENAHKEADTIMERSKLEIERETEKAKFELKQQTVQLAMMLSSKVLEETIDENKHKELINDFITKVGI